MNTNREQLQTLEENVCVHIFTVSAALVGVCLTVIGIIQIVVTSNKAETIADDILACDSVIFLTSCSLSYIALRSRHILRMHRVERVADALFIIGLFLMVCASIIIVYSIY